MAASGQVTLPQFRLLLALDGLGRVAVGQAGGPAGAGRLRHHPHGGPAEEQAGLVQRGTDPRSRCIVTVELTDCGRRTGRRGAGHRHERLAAVLDRMSPRGPRCCVRAAREFAALSGDAIAVGESGPVPV